MADNTPIWLSLTLLAITVLAEAVVIWYIA